MNATDMEIWLQMNEEGIKNEVCRNCAEQGNNYSIVENMTGRKIKITCKGVKILEKPLEAYQGKNYLTPKECKYRFELIVMLQELEKINDD